MLKTNTTATFLAALVSAVLLSALPATMVTAVHAESDSKRANDGFNDGSNAARTDTTLNPACDPLGLHTNDGQHTIIYCNAWNQGYTQTWYQLHQPQASIGPIIGQSQSPGALGQGQGQGSSNTCINVVNCNPSTNQKQGATGEVNNGQ